MKIHLLSIGLFASLFPLTAAETNPFIKKSSVKSPEPPAGAAFANIIEYCSVPSDLLNLWLDAHPLKGDAGELRKQVQLWINEKKASISSTVITTGVENRDSSVESIVEQIYPTECLPSTKETWGHPTAFETRNLGYTTVVEGIRENEKPSLKVSVEWARIFSQLTFFDKLAEKTMHPGDIFFTPLVASYHLTQPEPSMISKASNPFEKDESESERRVIFSPDKIHLTTRTNLPREDQASPSMSLLIFSRGGFAPQEPAPAPAAVPQEYVLSARIIRVPHQEFSNLLQQQNPLAAIDSPWSQVDSWVKTGSAEIINDVIVPGRSGTRIEFSDVFEYIYPTEWKHPDFESEAPKKSDDSKQDAAASSSDDRSSATSFETRNTGMTLQGTLSSDPTGLLLETEVSRVSKLGDTVTRRVKTAEGWVPDATVPLFGSFRITSTIRIQRSKWILAGSGANFLEHGETDSDHCLLVFIKVD